ncbi:MAG: SAM-dependent chlorinase/fluorinase [Rhodospirillaceae bacterium]|nr:SAM-dependent chlorinase/fluorinase [Rhodospirillaceae bacterium]
MFILFTDFGVAGPYLGQMKAKLIESAPESPIIDLFSDAPSQNPKAAAYLLAAYAEAFPKGSIFVCVVDPGVGGERPGVIVEAGGRCFVGPGNGLFEMILRRTEPAAEIWEINWQPDNISASFHGRDIFAPVAAMIANGDRKPGSERSVDWQRQNNWPDELAEVIYIDHYGNAITGIREHVVKPTIALRVNHVYLNKAVTFSSVPEGQAFWYVNSNGMVEIAANQRSAAEMFDLTVGTKIELSDAAHC